MENDIHELQMLFCPFGFLDMQAACHIWEAVWLYKRELFEIIDNFKESCGECGYTNSDPVYSVLEYILQMARSHIEEVTGYDFINDFSGHGTEIYTHGNFLCSSYDYSSEAVSELKEKIADHLDCLMQNKWCRYVLSELEIGVN